MSELSFLIDLLLNHDLQKDTKSAVAQRIKEVEQTLVPQPKLAPQMPYVSPAPKMPPVEQPVVIAQTPETAAALSERNNIISQAMAGSNKSIYKARPK